MMPEPVVGAQNSLIFTCYRILHGSPELQRSAGMYILLIYIYYRNLKVERISGFA